ncbi:MAG: thioredoxin [Candidatus Dojkabacteria bacterium]|nr:thioredoxin [Candidatus Dojkabacteria bacterium]
MAHVDVTDETFQEEVLNSNKVTLVDFWASWCMPCQMLNPILDQVEQELGDEVKMCKVNVDENRKTAEEYRIMSIPAVFVFKDGKQVEELIGLRQKEDYVRAVRQHAAA